MWLRRGFADFEPRMKMRYGMRWQKDKEFHGGKVSSASLHSGTLAGQLLDKSVLTLLKTKIIQLFLGVILFLVISLFLVLLGDRGSVTQVGLQLGLWPHTFNNLRATSELNYNNVYPEEEALRAKLRQDLRSLTTEEKHTSIAKPANNLGLLIDQEVPNPASGDHPEAVDKTDSQSYVEDAETTTEGVSILQKRLALNTSSLLDTHCDQERGVQFAAEEKGWIQFPYITVNETEQLMLQYRQNGTVPCHQIRTQSAKILGLPQLSKLEGEENPIIQLYAGPVYELLIVSVGEDGQPRCQGGDYYETDLSGPLWKSRPPVLDCNNGTYSVRLQMDPRFASGLYTFKVVLLFSNFHGLHYHPRRWARMEEVATYQIKFVLPEAELIALPTTDFRSEESSSVEAGSDSESSPITEVGPELPMCKLEDFSKKYWSGRWTRENATEDCEYDRYGRWQCVDLNLQCQKPWCEGRVGQLESNGWVYSAHCAFKIFEKEEAWQCLDGKWLFFWGDSNHMDTIRNLLNFFLGFDHKFTKMERRMDDTYISPLNNRSSVRITSMFNGHSNVTMNYEGLFSLHDPQYAQQLRSFFTGEVGPDFMIMNSGLHDGMYWKDVDIYMKDGVEFAANFWTNIWNQMKAKRPDLLYRTTVSTGGNARNMSFNPHKMELFNHLMVDKFLKMELERFHIIDGFDYTYPWHYDHKTNDGVHYGRAPSKSKWAGGNMGHQYFVDLMLVHMLLNAICAPSS